MHSVPTKVTLPLPLTTLPDVDVMLCYVIWLYIYDAYVLHMFGFGDLCMCAFTDACLITIAGSSSNQ